MRTTVTLDPDVESLLRREVRRRGEPFKQVLNNAIRSGLRNMAERAGQLGGRMEWHCPEDGGTTLVWRVPVARP